MIVAAEVVTTIIDISPILDPLIQIIGIALGAVVTAAVTALTVKLYKLLGVQEDNALGDRAREAGKTVAAMVTEEIKERAQDYRRMDVKDVALAKGAAYLVKTVPDALQKLGLTDEKGVVSEKTKSFVEGQIAKFNMPQPTPTVVVASADSSIKVTPL